jgi:hypothetical protein
MLDLEGGEILETVVDSLNSLSQRGKKICLSSAQVAKVSSLVKQKGIIGKVASHLLNNLK